MQEKTNLLKKSFKKLGELTAGRDIGSIPLNDPYYEFLPIHKKIWNSRFEPDVDPTIAAMFSEDDKLTEEIAKDFTYEISIDSELQNQWNQLMEQL